MTTVSRLPYSERPLVDESFASYIDRLSESLMLPINVVLARCGIYDAPVPMRPKSYGVGLSPARLAAFSAATGVPTQALARTLATSFNGVIGNWPREPTIVDFRKAWFFTAGSYVCPGCLEERGRAWRMRWKLPWSFACTRHRCLLVHRCPQCGWLTGHGQNSGNREMEYTAPRCLGVEGSPGRCRHHAPDHQAQVGHEARLCAFDLTSAQPHDLTAWQDLLDLQQAIDDCLDTGHAYFAGRRISAAAYLAELRALSRLLLHAADPDQFGPQPPFVNASIEEHVGDRQRRREELTPVTYRACPRDPALMAALLSAAVHVSEAQSDSELRVRISVFARALYENVDPKGLEPIRHRFGFTPAVTDAICDHLRRFRRQTYFDAAHRPSTLRPVRAEARHVPELIWHDAWDATFCRLIPTSEPIPARRFCALALVKHLNDSTWADAALALDLPESYSKSANHYVSRLVKARKQAIFRAEIAKTAGELGHSRPLVDYAARREHLRRRTRVPHRVLATTGITITARRQQFAAAWLWAYATEGDPFRSPAMPTPSRNDRNSFRRFRADTLPSIKDALTDYASTLRT